MRPNPSIYWLLRRTPAFWGGLLLAAMGLLALRIGFSGPAVDAPMASPRQAEGVVIARNVAAAESGESAERRQFITQFAFADHKGDHQRVTAVTPYSLWRTLAEGDAVQIVYPQAAPEFAELARVRRPAERSFATLLSGALCVALGGGLLLWSYRGAAMLQGLARHGAMRPGRVVEIRGFGAKVKGQRQFRLIYEYDDAHGRMHRGRSRIGPWSRFETLRPGQGATVYINPSAPAQSAWSGDLA